MRVILSLFVAVAICFGLVAFFSESIANQCGSELAAASFAKSSVMDQLSSPDGASFSNVQAHPDGDCTYLVAGKVSAQNAFGAKVQNTFSAMVAFSKASDDFTVYDVLITP
jgi:hypothetical protein